MTKARLRRLGIGLALAVGLSPLLAAPPAGQSIERQYYTGKVVPLAGLLEKFGSKLDADAAPHWLSLVTDDAKVYPLIQDDGGRMFFKDERLLNRPMRLTVRAFQNTALLQVLEVHSLREGKLHEVFYWCDICVIRRNEKKICECCGGPMELREEPVQR